MKGFYVFFAMVFWGILNISCSSSKKEIHREQTNTANTLVLPAAEKKTAAIDSMPSTALPYIASAMNDTVTGTLYVIGNEPFTTLMLSVAPDMNYLIEADSSLKSELWHLQGRRLGVIGTKNSSPMGIIMYVSSFRTIQ